MIRLLDSALSAHGRDPRLCRPSLARARGLGHRVQRQRVRRPRRARLAALRRAGACGRPHRASGARAAARPPGRAGGAHRLAGPLPPRGRRRLRTRPAADDERIAAVDELLALTLRELALLGELSAFASVDPLAADARRPLASTCAALLRLLDSALAAHGRDNGYRVDAWRKQTATTAWAIAAALGEHDDDTWPLPAAIDRTADRIADALTALGRDRVAVPERLVDAAGELLVIYAAATEF